MSREDNGGTTSQSCREEFGVYQDELSAKMISKFMAPCLADFNNLDEETTATTLKMLRDFFHWTNSQKTFGKYESLTNQNTDSKMQEFPF